MIDPRGVAELFRPGDERVLVVAAGPAAVAAAIRRRLPAARIDEIVPGGVDTLPYPAGWFDALVLADVLETAPDPARALRGVAELLSPRGQVIAALPAAGNLHVRLGLADTAARREERIARADDLRRWRRRDALRLFAGAGLDVTSLRIVPDPTLRSLPLPLDGKVADVDAQRLVLKGLTAEEIEELSAAEFLLTARSDAPKSRLDCSIVIPVFDQLGYTRRCLEALLERPPALRHELVVVDNGSTDGTGAYLESLGDAVRIISNPTNLGFGQACNQGVRAAYGDYVVLLNNDTIPHPGWCDALVECALANPGVGAVGAKLLYPLGTVQHAGVAFGPTGHTHQALPYHLYRHAPADAPHVNKARAVPAVTGACMLVPRRTFVRVGGFDERFRNGFEDVDLCLRLRARGLPILYCPTSVVTHFESVSADRTGFDTPNMRAFLVKWEGRLVADDELICRTDGTNVLEARARAAEVPTLRRRARSVPSSEPAAVVWSAPFRDRSGYADEARNAVLALAAAGVSVHADPMRWSGWETVAPPRTAAAIDRLIETPFPERFLHVIHWEPTSYARHPFAVRSIGRTMFETDRLPTHWVPKCRELDEIWVPSDFNVETFTRSGLDPERVHKVPEAIDLELYDGTAEPLPIQDARGFVFLSIFDWSLRKGWDVLVRAYVDEFRPEDDVTLVLKVHSGWRTPEHMRGEIEELVRRRLRRDPARIPRIVLLSSDPGVGGMPALYRAADAYVMPSRGEGWGRPYMEAMAMGLPTIGTRWSGNLEFMTDENSYLVDCELAKVPREAWEDIAGLYATPNSRPDGSGHRWVEPSAEHLRTLLRRVVERPKEAAAKGERARRDIRAACTWERVAEAVVERLEAGGTPPLVVAPAPRDAPTVRWEGPQFTAFGMAVVNRELCRELAGRVELTLASERPERVDARSAPLAAAVGRPLRRPADVHVRSGWPPRFDPPPEGRFVLVQPWEFGSAPKAWVDQINRLVDELWVPTAYVRECYVASGVDPARVAVVPNGIDPERFQPDAPPRELATRKSWKFLFVGGTIPRKGADILLETYLQTFEADDDVCLVVKDLGADSFYAGQGIRDRVERAQSDAASPEILYLDGELADEEMPGLYTACDCLVHPYRGEGFGLPIAEAMACGLPVIVPAHGACLDFCDASVAYLVPAREVRLPERRVGGLETVEEPWWAEVDRAELARAMQEVVRHRREAKARGRRASKRVRRELTWRRAADIALGRVEALGERPMRRLDAEPSAPPRPQELSVCMIVRNEERLLGRCLESVRGLADELVVVDTGSTDGTVEIARRFGARVHELRWQGDFAAARNEAIGHATKDWILMLDADMELDASVHAHIRRLIQSRKPVGYMLRQFNYTEAEGADSFVEHLNLRLFPNHPGIRYVGRVHEQLEAQPELGFRIEPSDAIVHHHGTRPQFENRRGKAERDSVALERMAAEEPANPFHRYNLGIAYWVLGRLADAEQELRRAIELTAPQRASGIYPHYVLHAYVSLAGLLLEQGRPDEAAESCREAIELAPDYADAHATLAAALARSGRLDGALTAYRSALAGNGRPASAPTDRALGGWKALLGMGEIYLLQERWPEALDALGRARALAPRNATVLARLAQAWRGLGRTAEAEELMRQAESAGAPLPT